MGMSTAAIRMGQAFVEIGGDIGPLRKALNSANSEIKMWGAGLATLGTSMLGAGLAMAGALVPAITQFANFEQALADMRAAANPTAMEFAQLREKIEAVSKATGMDPVEVTRAFSELVKAGKSASEVVNGLGESAVMFSRVSGLSAADTAVIMVDAMNLFGVTGSRAANVMSQAADATTTSLRDIAESFRQGGSAAGQYGLSIEEVATAIAVMSLGSIKGTQAGTAIKTLMTRLATGTADAGEASDQVSRAMQALGLNVYDAEGKMVPMVEILRRIRAGLAGMSDQEQAVALRNLAGMKGIQALLPLIKAGPEGFLEMQKKMESQLSVEQKFAIMLDTLWGSLKKLWVHIQFVAIAIGEALAPSIRTATQVLNPLLESLQKFVKIKPELAIAIAFDAVKAIAFGAALIALGSVIYGVAAAFSALTAVLSFFPIAVAIGLAITAMYLLLQLFPQVGSAISSFFSDTAEGSRLLMRSAFGEITEAFRGVKELLDGGDIEGAFQTMELSLELIWLRFKNFMLNVWDQILADLKSGWDTLVGGIERTINRIGIRARLLATGQDYSGEAVTRAEQAARASSESVQGQGQGVLTTSQMNAAWMAAHNAANAETRRLGLERGEVGSQARATYDAAYRAAYEQTLANEIRTRTQAAYDRDAATTAADAAAGRGTQQQADEARRLAERFRAAGQIAQTPAETQAALDERYSLANRSWFAALRLSRQSGEGLDANIASATREFMRFAPLDVQGFNAYRQDAINRARAFAENQALAGYMSDGYDLSVAAEYASDAGQRAAELMASAIRARNTQGPPVDRYAGMNDDQRRRQQEIDQLEARRNAYRDNRLADVREMVPWREIGASLDEGEAIMSDARNLMSLRDEARRGGDTALADDFQRQLDDFYDEWYHESMMRDVLRAPERTFAPGEAGGTGHGTAFGSFAGGAISGFGTISPIERAATTLEQIRQIAEEQRRLLDELLQSDDPGLAAI